MFGKTSCPARQNAIKNVIVMKTAPDMKVCEHVLKLMQHLSEAELVGAEVDKGSLIDLPIVAPCVSLVDP